MNVRRAAFFFFCFCLELTAQAVIAPVQLDQVGGVAWKIFVVTMVEPSAVVKNAMSYGPFTEWECCERFAEWGDQPL